MSYTAVESNTDKNLDEVRPISLNDIIEQCENLHGKVLAANLVALDRDGVPRYVIGWDMHTTESSADGEAFLVTTARFVFMLGDIADV